MSLDDRDRFPYFFRTVPSFSFVSIAMTEVIFHYQWKRVLLITQDNEEFRLVSRFLRGNLNLTPLIKHFVIKPCVEVAQIIGAKRSNFLAYLCTKNYTMALLHVATLTVQRELPTRCHPFSQSICLSGVKLAMLCVCVCVV